MGPKLADFEGAWRLDRVIEDRKAGLTGRLSGQAVWEPGQGGLVLTESGELRYGDGAPLRAERRYLWRDESDGIAVYFEDGRPFYWFSATEGDAHHDCPPDDYRVSYDFSGWPDWSARWTVRGPRKDYVMTSRYRPLSGG